MADTKLFVQRQPGGLFSVVDKSFCSGTIFYVDSSNAAASDTAGYGRNPDSPFATIDYAVGKCTASAGDVIFVLPGHTETIIAATSLVCDIAGVKIIGLGEGSLMPTLTFTTAAAATVSITAADVTLENLLLLSNYTGGITAGVTLGASADGCHLNGLIFKETANTKEWLIGVKITADCDDVIIENCKYCGTAGGTTSSIISALGGTDRSIIKNNYLHGDCSAAAVKLDGAASADLQVVNNRVINIDAAAGLGIAMHNSCTGFVAGNYVANLKDGDAGISGTGVAYCENYCSNALGAQGLLVPGADS